jgi:hypothetical protein
MPRLLLNSLMLFLNTGCKHATAAHVAVDPAFDDCEKGNVDRCGLLRCQTVTSMTPPIVASAVG